MWFHDLLETKTLVQEGVNQGFEGAVVLNHLVDQPVRLALTLMAIVGNIGIALLPSLIVRPALACLMAGHQRVFLGEDQHATRC